MICPYCNKREATIHYTEIRDGEMKHIWMCDTCARQRGIAANLPPQVREFMEKILGHQEQKDKLLQYVGTHCPECGLEFSAILDNNMKVGCANCYNVFEKAIREYLSDEGDGVFYGGKMPVNFDGKNDIKAEIVKLEAKLAAAIEDERYEECSILRDSIAKFQKLLGETNAR